MSRRTVSAHGSSGSWLLSSVLVQCGFFVSAAAGLALGLEAGGSSAGRTPLVAVDRPGGLFARDDEAQSPPSKKNGAMVVLYAVTGVVSGIFCIVIISGAIRAVRHPERYGPRRGDDVGATPQTRTQGLTRAILDTFPVIAFRSNPGGGAADGADGSERKDSASDDDKWDIVEMAELGHSAGAAGGSDRREATVSSVGTTKSALASEYGVPRASEERQQQQQQQQQSDHRHHHQQRGEGAEEESAVASGSGPSSPTARVRPPPTQARAEEPVMPDAIGRETCPICIVDFEEGEPVRVLPCNGAHRFHKECVDPWLLELSSSCPICRQDFAALETMITSDAPDDGALAPPQPTFSSGTRSSFGRFSRYVRIARHRSQRRQEQQQEQLSEFGLQREPGAEHHHHHRERGSGRSRERREESGGRRWRTGGRRASRSPVPDPTDPPMPLAEHTSL